MFTHTPPQQPPRATRRLVAGLVTVCLTGLAVVLTPASATATVHEAGATAQGVRYTDADVLALLLFAAGPIADEHPDLAARVQHGRTLPTAPPLDEVQVMVGRLTQVDPDYHEQVTVAIQQGDPFATEAAMKRLDHDIALIIAQDTKGTLARPGVVTEAAAHADGWFWHDAYIAAEAYVAAVAAAAVYEAAGVFHVAAVVVAIVPAALSYQFEMNQASAVDRQSMVSAVTQAAAA